jgi:hypothetical protein
MRRLIEFQGDLGTYVTNGHLPTPARGLLADETEDRLRVHRNNSLRACIDALASSYATVQRIVGASYFDVLGAAYVARHPPTTRSLVGYGEHFPGFVADAETLRGLPYLGDMARLDRAFLESSIAADCTALDIAAAAALPFEELAALAPGLLPSTRIVSLKWNVYDAWSANREEAEPPRTRVEQQAEYVLFARPQLEVAHAGITIAEGEFLQRVADGLTILAALESAVGIDPTCDPTLLIATAFRTGIFRGK